MLFMGQDTGFRATVTGSRCCRTTNTEKRANRGQSNSPLRSEHKYGKGNHDCGRRRRDGPLFLRMFLIRFLAEFSCQMGPRYPGRFVRDQAWGWGDR
jgi:hypothetical protein